MGIFGRDHPEIAPALVLSAFIHKSLSAHSHLAVSNPLSAFRQYLPSCLPCEAMNIERRRKLVQVTLLCTFAASDGNASMPIVLDQGASTD